MSFWNRGSRGGLHAGFKGWIYASGDSKKVEEKEVLQVPRAPVLKISVDAQKAVGIHVDAEEAGVEGNETPQAEGRGGGGDAAAATLPTSLTRGGEGGSCPASTSRASNTAVTVARPPRPRTHVRPSFSVMHKPPGHLRRVLSPPRRELEKMSRRALFTSCEHVDGCFPEFELYMPELPPPVTSAMHWCGAGVRSWDRLLLRRKPLVASGQPQTLYAKRSKPKF